MSAKKVKVFYMEQNARGIPLRGRTLDIEKNLASVRKHVGFAPISILLPNTNIHVFINISALDFESHPNAAFYVQNDIHAIFRGNILFCRCDVDLCTDDGMQTQLIDVITDITKSDIDYILSHFKRAYEDDGHLRFIDESEVDEYRYMKRFGENKRFKELTDKLMKPQGKSDTVGGELVRAVNRICGRYYNDGDVIGCGSGNEYCNLAGRYILQYGNYAMQGILEVLWNGRVRDTADAMWSAPYEMLLSMLVEETVKYIDSNAEELNRATPDMYDFALDSDSEYEE